MGEVIASLSYFFLAVLFTIFLVLFAIGIFMLIRIGIWFFWGKLGDNNLEMTPRWITRFGVRNSRRVK